MKRIATLLALIFVLGACNSSSSVGDSSDPKPDGNGDTKASTQAYCRLAVEAEEFESEFDNFDPSDVNAMRDLFNRIKETFAEIAPTVPAEIKADFEIGQRIFLEFIAEFEKVDYDITKFGPEAQAKLQTLFDSQEFNEASERIDKFNEAECGIKIDATS
ncbi:MAG: hypothetical protein ACLGH3_04130 [Actinomycetota bacterium]